MSSRKVEAKLIVVLGGCGFIGSSLCRGLLDAGYRVRVFKKSKTSMERIALLVGDVEVVNGDQACSDEVVSAIKDADALIHLIHTSVPSSSMKAPAFELSSNVASTAAWLSRLGETRLRRIIYISSGGTVYGSPRSLPVSEDHPLNPISVYGIAKLACEKLVAMYSEMMGIDYRIVRPSNAYGEGQPVNRNQGILGVLADRIRQRKPIEIWGSGEGLRDYIHVDDVVESLVALLAHSGPSRVFNVSTGVGHSVLDVIRAFRARTQHLPEVVHLPARGFDVPDNVLDNCRLKQETGWLPKVSLDAGIDRLFAGAEIGESNLEVGNPSVHINCSATE